MKATIPGMPTGWDLNDRGRSWQKKARVQRGTKVVAREHVPVCAYPREGKLVLYLDFYQPDKRKRDIDQLIQKAKPIIDVLQERGWMKDDSQIVKLIADKDHLDRKNPRTVVELIGLMEE